jgi:hypothetical protein
MDKGDIVVFVFVLFLASWGVLLFYNDYQAAKERNQMIEEIIGTEYITNCEYCKVSEYYTKDGNCLGTLYKNIDQSFWTTKVRSIEVIEINKQCT